MNDPKNCDECEQIVTEMRAAFLKLIHTRPKGDLAARADLVQFLSSLFASEPDLARLSEQWDESEFGAARHRWMDHRITTGHVAALLPVFN